MSRVWLVACVLAVLLVSNESSTARATHDTFTFKWPWNWNASATINTLPYDNVHGCFGNPGAVPPYECVAAYDLGISNLGVLAGSESVVTGFQDGISTCSSGGGFGNFVQAGGATYAHLAVLAPSVAMGTTLLQGDGVGTEGATGNVLPCVTPDDQSGKHLHWQIGASGGPRPPGIDGTNTAPLTVASRPASTNSVIGEFSTMGATLRAYYQSHLGWTGIGWTYNHGAGLNMFNNRSWGRIQDFRHHPDGFGGEFDTIAVQSWNPSQAYLIDSVFWQAWASSSRPIGNPRGERVTPCPSGFTSNCLSYQPFLLGFVWMDGSTGRTPVFCPDIDGDRVISILDLVAEAKRYGLTPVPPAVDVDGDGVVSIIDLVGMASTYGASCSR